MKPTNIQWVINIYTILTASLLLIAGKLNDIFSKKRLFLIGVSLYLIASVIIATSPGYTMIFIGRAMQGISAAFITTSSLSILKTVFSDSELNFAVGIWSSLICIGNAIGPFGGGFITEFFGWRYIFWLNFILFLVPAFIVIFLLKKEYLQKSSAKQIDYLGFILFCIGMLLLVVGLTEVNAYGWKNPIIYIITFSGLTLLSVFYFYEKKHSNPLLNFNCLKNRLFTVSILGLSLSTFTAMLIPYFLNFYLQNPVTYNYSPLMAGLILFIFAGASFIGAGFSSLIIKFFGNRKSAFLAFALLILPFTYLGLCINDIGIYQLSFILFFTGLGVGITEPLFSAIGLNLFHKDESGQISGILNTGIYVSELLAVISGSILFFTFGRSRLNNIDKAFVHNNVDKLLIGDHSTFSKLSGLISPHESDHILTIIRKSTAISFSSVILLTVIICIIIFLLCYKFLKNK